MNGLTIFQGSDVTEQVTAFMVAEHGEAKARAAASSVLIAFEGAIKRSKDPGALLKCPADSVAQAALDLARLGLTVSGPAPQAYLLPRDGRLILSVSHRGYAALYKRSTGNDLEVVLVPEWDKTELTVQAGRVTAHKSTQPWREPSGVGELLGAYVVESKNGQILRQLWVSGDALRKRASKGGPVWKSWPLEMAMKTAILYMVARGALVFEVLLPESDTEHETGEVEQAQQPTRLPPVQTVQDAEFEEGEIGPSLLETVQRMLSQAYACEKVNNDIPDRSKGEAEQADWDKTYGDRWAQVVRRFRADMGIKMKPEQMAPAQLEELAGKLRAYLEINGGGAK